MTESKCRVFKFGGAYKCFEHYRAWMEDEGNDGACEQWDGKAIEVTTDKEFMIGKKEGEPNDLLESRKQSALLDLQFYMYASGILVEAKPMLRAYPQIHDTLIDMLRLSYRAGYYQRDDEIK